MLAGKVAIVTGGTAGIGLLTGRALARRGAQVVVVGRDRARLERTVVSLGQETDAREPLGLCGDVCCEFDMARVTRQTLERFGSVDILITAAGVLRPHEAQTLKTLAQTTTGEWDEVVDTNLRGVFLSNKAVLGAMVRQRRGHIINVSSTSGKKAYAFDAAYCASKFAVIGLTQAVAEEVRGYGVKVEVVLPGAVDTPMWEQNGPMGRPEYALPPQRVSDLILSMLTLPDDATFLSPVIEPFAKPHREGWLGASSGYSD